MSASVSSRKPIHLTSNELSTPPRNQDGRYDDDNIARDQTGDITGKAVDKASERDGTAGEFQPHARSDEHSQNYTPQKTIIKCRNCGDPHFTIQCPLRSPDMRPRTWEQSVCLFDEKQESMPLHCSIPLHPGKTAQVHATTVEEFWKDIKLAHEHSLYRAYCGIINFEKQGRTIASDHQSVPPGIYSFHGPTISMTDEALYKVLDDACEVLRCHRPISKEAIENIQGEILLRFNHFSLRHEGNELGLDETKLIINILARADPKHSKQFDELKGEITQVSSSDHDIKEAINHIQVSQQLVAMSRADITEETILYLHRMVMDGLLTNADEGLPGEYRKVSIGVEGDSRPRPLPADVPPLMNKWVSELKNKGKDEHLVGFLSRIHSKFQDIHPFRDRNGRIGRLVMNLILVQSGYPILTFPNTLSSMFNQGVSTGIRGNYTIFSRLIAESLYSSFQAYEGGLGIQLLPDVRLDAIPKHFDDRSSVLVTP